MRELIVLCVLALAFVASPAFAQERETAMQRDARAILTACETSVRAYASEWVQDQVSQGAEQSAATRDFSGRVMGRIVLRMIAMGPRQLDRALQIARGQRSPEATMYNCMHRQRFTQLTGGPWHGQPMPSVSNPETAAQLAQLQGQCRPPIAALQAEANAQVGRDGWTQGDADEAVLDVVYQLSVNALMLSPAGANSMLDRGGRQRGADWPPSQTALADCLDAARYQQLTGQPWRAGVM